MFQELGLPKQTPKTIESTRVLNEDTVQLDDEEVKIDESLDEMSSYFRKEIVPNILITTVYNPHTKTIKFCRELRNTIPNSVFRFRRKTSIKKIVKCASDRGYTDLIVINEDWRKPSMLIIIVNLYFYFYFCLFIDAFLHIHLPEGPTAYYKLSSVRYCKEIKVWSFFVSLFFVVYLICLLNFRIGLNSTIVVLR